MCKESDLLLVHNSADVIELQRCKKMKRKTRKEQESNRPNSIVSGHRKTEEEGRRFSTIKIRIFTVYKKILGFAFISCIIVRVSQS